MPDIVSNTHDMISSMSPVLLPDRYVFASLPLDRTDISLLRNALATYREDEGMSLILRTDAARQAGLSVDQPMRCITLKVYSSLEGVGLTAAVSRVLAENGIACNMVAAFHHDHAFVPEEYAERAVELLETLQSEAAKTSPQEK